MFTSAFKINETLNATELNQLTTLAQQCPFTDGTAVYQARALLTYFDDTEYANSCETNASASRSSSSEDQSINLGYQALQTLVYPNPVKDELFVETQFQNATIIIYSILGQEVLNAKLIESRTRLSLDNLNNGTYLYKIVNANGELIKTDKLILNK